MIEYLWDEIKDCEWEQLGEKIIGVSTRFKEDMLEIVLNSPDREIQELINEETLNRFTALSCTMGKNLKLGMDFERESVDNKTDNTYKLNAWILLGSLTECALQIFLAFYIDDYRKSKWKQWEDLDVDNVKNPIINTINTLVKEGTLTLSQGKSLKKSIKEKIREHTEEHQVQKVMFDEIIQFYSSMKIMDADEINYLKQIQSNRNGIHSFENRTVGDWRDLRNCVVFWCYLLSWILHRLPEVPDEYMN